MSSSRPAISRCPTCPYFEGFSTFNGRILHSHDFRDAMEFKGKDILIIGRSYSAEDIGSQCYKYGAKSITSSYRSKPMGFKWPENWKEVPLLQKVVGKTAHFKDGSTKDVDAIILCTGYLHNFPFLTEDLKLKTANRMWPLGLYRGRRLGEEPEAVLHRHAGPVLHLQHVRRAGLVRARRHHGPHQIAVGRGDGRARREMAGARGNARGCRADDLVPGRLHQGADGADRLSELRHRGDQPDLHGVGAPQGARTSWASATTPTAR